MEFLDLIILVLVGAFWGCTNPFLRKGAVEAKTSSSESQAPGTNDDSLFQVLRASAAKFLNIRVWFPYALNQSGSILFYVALSRSDLTLAVPICNALSLVFSVVTSFALGESVDKPGRAVLGAALVMIGVGICVNSREDQEGTEGVEAT